MKGGKKMKGIMKKCLKSILAFTMVFTSLTVGSVTIAEAATTDTAYAVSEYTPKYGSTITVDRWDGDHIVDLPSLPAATEFTFTADVEIENSDNDQESAALIFGTNGGDRNFANVHGQGAHFAQVWGFSSGDWGDTDHLYLGSARDSINLNEKFRMSLNVTKDDNGYKLTYSLSSYDDEGNIDKTCSTSGYLTNYTGGTFGLMTHHTKATYSNLNLTYKDGSTTKTVTYGTYEKTTDGDFVVEGTNGDAHLLMTDPNVVSAADFVYETDVDLIAGPSVALTFGIEDPNNIGASWVGANFNFNDENGNGRIRVFQVKNGDPTVCEAKVDANGKTFAEVIQRNKTIHLKLEVTKDGQVTFTVNNKGEDEAIVATGSFANAGLTYVPGTLGILCFDSSAKFSNTTIALGNNFEITNSTDFSGAIVDKTNDTVTITDNNGDHFSMFAIPVSTNAFTLEADVTFTSEGNRSAGLVFGSSSSSTGGSPWYAANVDTARAGGSDCFRMFGGGTDPICKSEKGEIDLDKPLHLKIVVDVDGNYSYTFGNADGSASKTLEGTISDWNGGYLGLLTHKSSAVFSNIHVINNNTIKTVETTPLENTTGWNTNLTSPSYDAGTWTTDTTGLTSVSNNGDAFLLTESTGSNFVYSTKLTFNVEDGSTRGDAGIVFRSNNDLITKEGYGVNVSETSGDTANVKFWRWYRNSAYQLIDTKQVPKSSTHTYELKVVAYDTWILYYVNDTLVASLGDYNLQYGDLGQPTAIKSGYFGLVNWNGNVTYQDTYYCEFNDEFNPILENIYVTSNTGTVEDLTQFTPEEPTMIQYVKNNASTVNVNVTAENEDSVITVTDANGTVYPNGQNIPVAVGKNIITVTSTSTYTKDGVTYDATVTHHVNVHRLDKDEIYYNETYRDQYHYSVLEGWANDPNGMVYYNGEWHLFHQFYDDTVWGPMHWAHATSEDLIHWTIEPMAMYPDANGTQFSGCMVVDEKNTSGLFKNEDGTKAATGGLVALITDNGNGQRIKLAYSTDGDNWTKVDEIAADWSDDPLANVDFRDPKVFRWENKWFMVIAGGPLRIYSSDDLLSWECESTYDWLHTECPDLYPIQADNGTIKWVLSRAGRGYKVGDFVEVDGNWTFVPDDAYLNTDGTMNYAMDSYAAMTYYVQDFGSATTPTLPEIIEINWMNNWSYCNSIANTVGQKFNGTFNLNLSLGLTYVNGKYVLTQTPITETSTHGGYEELRTGRILDTNGYVTVSTDNDLLSNLSSSTYEIEATFKPGEDTTRVGFKVRTGNDQETYVYYDLNTKTINIDRSKSSSYYFNSDFMNVASQYVSENADGTIDMHIYVDKASVEVFTNGHTTAGAVQIFPNPTSLGASVVVEGGDAQADITVYELGTIWTDKIIATTPISVESTSKTSQSVGVGKDVTLSAYVLPIEVKQDIEWTIMSGGEYVNLTVVDNEAVITGKAIGTAVVRATAKGTDVYKDFTINVHNFNTNIDSWTNVSGDWTISGETLSDANTGRNDYYMSTERVNATDYVIETDLAFNSGLINLFVSSDEHGNHMAYSVQFDNYGMVRLFYFAGDTIKTEYIADYNDNGFFHVKVEKSGMTMKVYVNDALALEHTFDSVLDFYNGPAYVGVGLWNGDVSVQNFFVYADTDLNTDELYAQVDRYDALDKDVYTDASVEAVETILDKIEGILNDPATTQEDVDALTAELKAAIDGLVEKTTESTPVAPGTGDSTNVAGLLVLMFAALMVLESKRRKA